MNLAIRYSTSKFMLQAVKLKTPDLESTFNLKFQESKSTLSFADIAEGKKQLYVTIDSKEIKIKIHK